MKIKVEVADREEAEQLRAGLSDPETHALVRIIGIMKDKSPREQKRVLSFVYDQITDPDFIEG